MVEHPDTDIGITKKTAFYHDGTIHHGLADGADVSMQTQQYCLNFNIYNLLTTNQYNFEDGTTDGWGPQGTGTTLSTVSPGNVGDYAMRVQTPGSVSGEGVLQSPYSVLPNVNNVGLPVIVKGALKGTGTVKFQIQERDISGTTLSSVEGVDIPLTSSYIYHYLTHTITNPNTRVISVKIVTTSVQTADIYIDAVTLNPLPANNIITWLGIPSNSNRYGLIIIKTDPTTIKSDSIPASDVTGIGVYDQMRVSDHADGYVSLSDEFMIQPWHRVGVRQL
jgi:hypothetical protein